MLFGLTKKGARELTMADRRPIVANYLATNRKPKSVANSLFADLRFRAALVAVLRGRRNFPRENFGFQDLCNKLLYDLTITFQLPSVRKQLSGAV